MTELQKRIGVSLIFIPLLLAALWLGGIYLIIMFALVSLLGGFEYIQMLRYSGNTICWRWLPLIGGTFFLLSLTRAWDIEVLWALFIIAVIDALIGFDAQTSLPKAFAALFGAVWLGIMPALIVRIGLDYSSQKLLFALVIMIWIVDSAAYFAGMLFGRHRNVTVVSPRKSVEGFLAGVLVPFLIAFILYIVNTSFISARQIALIAIAAGIAGQLGDLAESMLKRHCGMKDSSKLIPGHGGILDRTDSILLAGSFLYCVLSILDKVR